MANIISSLLATQPNGMWETIITFFESGIGNFAISIILLTLIIKIIMSPIDFFNRRTSKNMAKMQAKIQPQMEAINKKYANDPNLKNQKLSELYKREKINPMGSCWVMLLNLGLTLAIFITLLNGMNAMASYKIQDQYEQLMVAYVQDYAGEELNLDQEGLSIYEICSPFVIEMNSLEDGEEKIQILNNANQNVIETYEKTKESFLWIDNIWMADSPFNNSVPSYSEYANVARLSNEERNNEEFESVYDYIMNPLRETRGRTNGYFILLVICAGVTFLNQWLVIRKNKQNGVAQKAGWGTAIFMTVFMAFFTLFYTTMFSLYMITGQIVGLVMTPIFDAINNAIDKHQEKKNEPKDRLKRI